jgi:chemotaxis protein methyltransferase CheR
MTMLSDAGFTYVRDLVREHAAVVLEEGKAYLIESRLSTIARREGAGSVSELVNRLELQAFGRVHDEVVEAMITKETSWFRDLHPFDALRDHVLPALVAARGPEETITIWCAACSTGQEPYTVAMLLRDHFPELVGTPKFRLLASDISKSVVDRARAGCYTQTEVNRGLPAALRLRYLRQDGPYWRVDDGLRRMVQFGTVNLAGRWPPLPPLDVILLRNVMIYFDLETKRSVLAKVRQVLRHDGFLFLGNAETTIDVDDAFERVQLGAGNCYRTHPPRPR